MTYEQAAKKAEETATLNGRPFKVVPVTYRNGERGFDVTPAETRMSLEAALIDAEQYRS